MADDRERIHMELGHFAHALALVFATLKNKTNGKDKRIGKA